MVAYDESISNTLYFSIAIAKERDNGREKKKMTREQAESPITIVGTVLVEKRLKIARIEFNPNSFRPIE